MAPGGRAPGRAGRGRRAAEGLAVDLPAAAGLEGPAGRGADTGADLGVGGAAGRRDGVGCARLWRPVRLARTDAPARPGRAARRRRRVVARGRCPDRPRLRPGAAPRGGPRGGGAQRRGRRPGRGAAAAGRDRPRRAEPERRVQRRPGRRHVRHRPRAVRHGPRAASEGSPAGRPARHPRAADAGRPRRPHRPRRRSLRADAAPRRGGGGARLPRAVVRRRRPDLRPGRADRSGHAVRRRRAAGAQQARRHRMAAGQAARPQGGRGARRRAARPVRVARERRGACVLDRHAMAGRDGGVVPVRGDHRPAASDRGGQGRHGAPRPMDRLVVGDVGYGKTEVALRGAFKATQDGKQVAVLVPTTVLAAQHYTTFGQRFAAFPLEVRLLSRFVSAKDQAATIAGLADGSVDIVIGTHRLLSKDVRFKRPRARRRRRGAALRRGRQGAAQAAAARGRRADAVGDADPAHAEPGAGRHPRHVASSRRRPRTACRSRPGSPRRRPGSSATRSCASSTAAARSSSSTTGSRRSRRRPSSCVACCPTHGSWSATARCPRARSRR